VVVLVLVLVLLLVVGAGAALGALLHPATRRARAIVRRRMGRRWRTVVMTV
jgi:hypothetical protein